MSISSFTKWYRDIVQVRWKAFNGFAANLFRKIYVPYQNRPDFIEDITKNIWSLFLDTLYM